MTDTKQTPEGCPNSELLAGQTPRCHPRFFWTDRFSLTSMLFLLAAKPPNDIFGKDNPDFGEDLYVAVAKAAVEHGGLIPLKDTEETRRKSDTQIRRKLAYLQEGAFTQFLIERYGLNAYFRIFHGTPTNDAVGESMEELEAEWTKLIRSMPIWSKKKLGDSHAQERD